MSDSMPEVRLLFSSPAHVWHVVSSPISMNKPNVKILGVLINFVSQGLLPPNIFGADFRSMSIDRLSTVLDNGIDVVPTDSVIYVDGIDKALEYGEWPKILLALDPKQLSRTWEEVESNAPVEKLDMLRRTYQTEIKIEEGSKFWFSRLHKDDSKLESSYERFYAKYIPGDSKSALMAVFVFAEADWSPHSSIAL